MKTEYDIGVGCVILQAYRDLRKNIAIVVVVVAEDGILYCQFLKVSSSAARMSAHNETWHVIMSM